MVFNSAFKGLRDKDTPASQYDKVLPTEQIFSERITRLPSHSDVSPAQAESWRTIPMSTEQWPDRADCSCGQRHGAEVESS